jgi:hypothetical protein
MEPTDQLDAPNRRLPESRVRRFAQRDSACRQPSIFLVNPSLSITSRIRHVGCGRLLRPCFGAPQGQRRDSPFIAIRRSDTSVTLGVECSRETICEVDRRGARTAATVHLERPSRLVHLANDRASLLERRSGCRKVERIGTDSSNAQRRRHATVAGARGGVWTAARSRNA